MALEVENTLEAFALAVEGGADGVELDVRLCASGEVVVFHDDDLTRLAGRPERISRIRLAELRRVRLERDRRVPTLDEVFEALLPDTLIDIEIKSRRPWESAALVRAVIDTVHRWGAEQRVLISSFDPFALARVRRRAPRIATGYLFHSQQSLPLRNAWIARLLAPFAVHPQTELVTAHKVLGWRSRGYAVNPWTADEPTELRRLADLGVDMVMSNDPARAVQVVKGPK